MDASTLGAYWGLPPLGDRADEPSAPPRRTERRAQDIHWPTFAMLIISTNSTVTGPAGSFTSSAREQDSHQRRLL